MFYDDADFVGFDPLDSLAVTVHSSREVDVVILRDGYRDSAGVYYASDGRGLIPLEHLGEINMGSPTTLYDFVTRAKRICPAERYMLAFYDHGGGWRGACWDVANQNDNLTMEEIKGALQDAGGVDIVLFTAPCLMGAVESVYELRGCTDVYVGSEAPSGYCWWNEPMRHICVKMETEPDLSTYELGEYIIEAIAGYKDIWASADWAEDFTMCAVRTDRVGELAGALDELAADYLSCPLRLFARLTWVYGRITMFNEECIDIGDFVDELLKVEEFDSTRVRLEAVKACLEDAVIAECHGAIWPAVYGLTIYFPYRSVYGCSPEYNDPEAALDFVEDTCWDELLSVYQYPQPVPPADGTMDTYLSSDGFAPR
jgi:hypothetical protein